MGFNPVTATTLLVTGGLLCSQLASGAQAAPPRAEASPAVKSESPLACNLTALTPAERARHFDEVGPKLRSMRKGVRELPDGYELEFPADTSTYRLLTEWAAAERACCPFFDIDVRSTREGGPLLLRLTGREGVKQFIKIDGAAWLKQ